MCHCAGSPWNRDQSLPCGVGGEPCRKARDSQSMRRLRQRGVVRTLLVRPAPPELSEFTRRKCSPELRRWRVYMGMCRKISWAAVGHAGLELLSGRARLWNPLVSPSVQMAPPGTVQPHGKLTSAAYAVQAERALAPAAHGMPSMT